MKTSFVLVVFAALFMAVPAAMAADGTFAAPQPTGSVNNIPPPPPALARQPEQEGLSDENALQLAMDAAPPSYTSYEARHRTYRDKPAYSVVFETPDGPHEVLVDLETGAILKR